MADLALQCPKCNGSMEQGFILDQSYGARFVSSWTPGIPRKSFWTGTKQPNLNGIPIGVFRCASCGFLECYQPVEKWDWLRANFRFLRQFDVAARCLSHFSTGCYARESFAAE